nr:ankyrin repeat domain-containing protein 10-like [Halyomorpha halys]
MKEVFLLALVGFANAIPCYSSGCLPDPKGNKGQTTENVPYSNNTLFPILKLAAMQGDEGKLYDILSHPEANGVSTINDTDYEGMTALHWASLLGRTQAVKALLFFNADVLQVDNNSNTALHFAALSGSHHGIPWLVSFGSNVNAKNRVGKTPLHLAIEEGVFSVVMTLIEFGADIQIRDGKRTLPVDLAISKGNVPIIRLLKSIDNKGETHQPELHQWVSKDKITNPVVGGRDYWCDEGVYVGRVKHDGEIIPAKVCKTEAYAAHKGKELMSKDFEILDSINIAWKPLTENDTIPTEAIVGGRSKDGENYYVGKANIYYDCRSYITPGKIPAGEKRLHVTFGFKEYIFTKYEILVLHF